MKGHRPFPPYLPLSILTPLIFPLPLFGHWVCHTRKGCTLPCGKKGLKAQRGKSSWQELKAKMKPLRCFAQGFPRKQ
jgi:hypothetical protein